MTLEAMIRAIMEQNNQLPLTKETVNAVIDPIHHHRPLHLAVIYSNNKRLFSFLLKLGASVDEKNRSGLTVLGLAQRYQRTSLWQAMQELKEEAEMTNRSLAREVDALNKEKEELRASKEAASRRLQELQTEHQDLVQSFHNLSSSLRKRRRLE